MNEAEMIGRAFLLASRVHATEADPIYARPYMEHIVRVAAVFTGKSKAAALLHDIFGGESQSPSKVTEVTSDVVRRDGLEELLPILRILTRQKGETWADYIDRVAKDETAAAIIFADLADHIATDRENRVNKSLKERYSKAFVKLGTILSGSEAGMRAITNIVEYYTGLLVGFQL